MRSKLRAPRGKYQLVDQARVFVKGGDGGDGAVTFRREKYIPRGGPDGGDGGNGGNVLLRAQPGLSTLLDCVLRQRYLAPNGKPGARKNCHGANGEHIEISVPAGTLVRREEDGGLLADLTLPGQTFLVARGGRGGRGNAQFATPTRRVPRFAEKGEPGDSLWLTLELRLLADVGVIGLPNAGKSTLISRLSAARPKIAPYPFTTLSPILGVVRVGEDCSLVLADMPGLIEGAHLGLGLGHEFLRHIERTRLLVHLLDISLPDRDPLADLETVNRELVRHRAQLAELPQIIVLNKIDLPDAKDALSRLLGRFRRHGQEVFPISAVTGEGVDALVNAVAARLKEAKAAAPVPGQVEEIVSVVPSAAVEIEQAEEGVFLVKGEEIERQARRLAAENEEAMVYLYRRLGQKGILRKLAHLGARAGDKIRVAGRELEYRG